MQSPLDQGEEAVTARGTGLMHRLQFERRPRSVAACEGSGRLVQSAGSSNLLNQAMIWTKSILPILRALAAACSRPQQPQ